MFRRGNDGLVWRGFLSYVTIRKIDTFAASEEAGYEITEGTFGAVAEDAFSTIGLELVILDVSFSETGIDDLCRHIKDTTDNISVFVVGNVNNVNEVVQALTHGADGYMAKPFDPREFLARIRVEFRNRKTWRLDSSKTPRIGNPAAMLAEALPKNQTIFLPSFL